ncbi:MAG: type IV pilus twitching motility protein PilT [Thermoanaerobaculia bacterium]
MARLDPLLRQLAKRPSATLLLEPGRRPRLTDGDGEQDASRTVLQSEQIMALVKETSPDPSVGRFRYSVDGQDFDFSIVLDNGDCRATISQPRADPVVEWATPAGPERLPEISELLDTVITRNGSDLHLSSRQKPRMRVYGELLELEQYLPPKHRELRERLWQVTPERNRKEFEEDHDTDFALELPGQARFRVNLFRDRAGIAAVFRQIPYEIPTFEELGLPEVVRSLAHLSKGLVLVTGPTGSGKSTTLAAILDLINASRPDHIITIEDPIEFVHGSKRSLIHQREPGVHTRSFAKALRAALREDPDVILVGEMRDLETISIAIETAETGHLVLGTLHTSTAPSTVERIVDQFPGDRQQQVRMMLADGLRAVVAQTLLKKIDGGRVAAFEILICTPAVSNLIREGKTFQIASAMQTGRQLGMMTQTDSLYQLVSKKIVTAEEAYLKAADKEALVKKLEADGITVRMAT